jgi:hypothetical protein
VIGGVVCADDVEDGCRAVVLHSAVSGAVGYVVDNPAVGRIPCQQDVGGLLCFAFFPKGAPSGCTTTLRAVDDEGRAGRASEPFCVLGSATVSGSGDQLTRTGSSRQQNSTFARTPAVRANG